MLISEIINAAGRKLGLIKSGGTLTASELADGLSALQSMLRSWAAEKINVFAAVNETITLVSGTYLYTWGSGGTISTTRPHKIINAYVIDSSGVSHSVNIISAAQYDAIVVKTSSGRPDSLFLRFEYPLAKLYLYPAPNSAESLVVNSVKPFTEASSFSATSDTLAMPVNYEEPIIYNLAIRMASEYGITISGGVLAIARESYDRLITLNSANYIEPVKLKFPAGSYDNYNINTGE